MQNSPIWGSHQTIEFPDGYTLKGGRDTSTSRFEMFSLPDDLSGQSVLDIGCNIGSIAMECKKRNASRVLGLDYSPGLVDCASGLAKIFDLDIEYRLFNIANDSIDEEFDYVFLLNVFHHLDEQSRVSILRTLSRITKKKLLFEAPVADDIIAKTGVCFRTEDYLSYFKGFTDFKNIELVGYTDFKRPLIVCEV